FSNFSLEVTRKRRADGQRFGAVTDLLHAVIGVDQYLGDARMANHAVDPHFLRRPTELRIFATTFSVCGVEIAQAMIDLRIRIDRNGSLLAIVGAILRVDATPEGRSQRHD